MLENSFGLIFFLRKKKSNPQNAAAIYLKLTIDKIPIELSLKRSWDPRKWNYHTGRPIGTREDAKSLHAYIDAITLRVFEAKRHLVELGKPVTAKCIKEILSGGDERHRLLLQCFSDFNSDVEKLIGKDYSFSTWEKYDRTRRLVSGFIQYRFQEHDVSLYSLNMEFINQFEIWLKTQRNCGQNTSMKYISILKMITNYCVANEWLAKDPFANFRIALEEVTPEFLSKQELQTIAEKTIKIERLRQVRDVYLFCCYTGLAYSDINKLSINDIAVGVDDEHWIFTKRTKTKTLSRIPLLPLAKKIIEKYKDFPSCASKGRLLPVLSNQKYNSYLKELADICGIAKNLTTHTARHTFATTVTLNNGVPIESVAKMLGHKKLQTTQHYARVLDTKLSEDMNRLRNLLHQGSGE